MSARGRWQALRRSACENPPSYHERSATGTKSRNGAKKSHLPVSAPRLSVLPRGSEGPLREGKGMSVFHGVVHLSFSCSYDGRFVLRGARQFPDKADSLPQGFGKDRWELLTASRKLLCLSRVSTTGTSRRIRLFLDQ